MLYYLCVVALLVDWQSRCGREEVLDDADEMQNIDKSSLPLLPLDLSLRISITISTDSEREQRLLRRVDRRRVLFCYGGSE